MDPRLRGDGGRGDDGRLRGDDASSEAVDTPPIKPLAQAIAELEAQSIRAALAATGGNKLAASRLLGISRATLYEKLPLIETPT